LAGSIQKTIMNSTESAERYVSGRMDETEERQFEEEVLMVQPDVAADVDLRHRIKLGLQALDERGELAALVERPPRRTTWQYALAASALLAVGAAIAYWQYASAARAVMSGSLAALTGGASQPISASYIFASTRSRTQGPVITVARGAGAIRIRVVQESGLEQSFVGSLAAVSARGENVVAERVPFESGGNGLVEVFLDPRDLESGRYVLRLAPESDAGSRQEFPFTLNLTR
jgi:hypothetical protein